MTAAATECEAEQVSVAVKAETGRFKTIEALAVVVDEVAMDALGDEAVDAKW